MKICWTKSALPHPNLFCLDGDFMKSEELLIEADKIGIPVTEKPFKTFDGRVKGEKIYLRSGMSDVQKTCVLSEEIGHLCTGAGCIVEQQTTDDIKQERRARIWAGNYLVGLSGLIDAFQNNCRNLYEMAEYLEVTEEFLLETLKYYREKYGTGIKYKDYYIRFEPNLMIYRL